MGLHKMFLVLENLDRDEMPPMDFHQTGTGTFHHLISHKLPSFKQWVSRSRELSGFRDWAEARRLAGTHSRSVWPRVEGGTSHGRAYWSSGQGDFFI